MSTTDTRRGANWTPPADGAQCFEAALDEGSPEETCLHCRKHIRHHFGGTEYRCDARESNARTKDIDPDFRREPKTDRYCCRCQKDIKPEAVARKVYLRGEGAIAVHPEDVAAHARVKDIGWCLIGSECVRIIGKEWTIAESDKPVEDGAGDACVLDEKRLVALILKQTPLGSGMTGLRVHPDVATDIARDICAETARAIQTGEVEREGLRRERDALRAAVEYAKRPPPGLVLVGEQMPGALIACMRQRDEAKADRESLRVAIERAPHGADCRGGRMLSGIEMDCTCWKAALSGRETP